MEYGLTLMAVDPPEPFLDMVRFADESAYDFMWVCDSSLHDRYVYCYLTLLATNSKNLLFGPNCTHPHTRHPAMNFNALCTLDKLSGGRTVMNLGAGDRPVMELGFKMAKVIPDELVDKFTISGPPDYCVERFNALKAIGITHFELFPVGEDRHQTARRFAQEVIPQLY
jgi:alkanesulfonate monooxygenase SsuD/methylene tetrahydromethanopterin reductase-like flavin-dependent oxidoreductase (luciferase family)